MKGEAKTFLLGTYNENEKNKIKNMCKMLSKVQRKKWKELYGKKLIED